MAVAQHLIDRAPAMPVVPATILVAEDDVDICDLIAFKLEMSGYRVVTTGDGTSALRLAQSEQPDLVVLDIGLPGLDGLSVCHALQATTSTARIPVLMLSGRTAQNDIDLGFTVGAGDYMIKPFRPGDLVQRVGWLLGGVN